jgi:catechol 2,3-dioxygenase-like lactoylglutathione lyase family enzyme
MIDHLSFYATDYLATKRFYEQALAPLEAAVVMEMTATWNPEWPEQRMCAFGPPNRPIFWIIETKTPATPRHLAFTAKDRAGVDAFHAAALAGGGKDNGAPGLRPQYHRGYYGAFVLDPDGNNVEAVTHRPE